MSAVGGVSSEDAAYGLLAWAYNLRMQTADAETTVLWIRETQKYLQSRAEARENYRALNENPLTKGNTMSNKSETVQPNPTTPEEAPQEQPRFDKRRIVKVAAISVAAVATVAVVVTKLKNRDSQEPVQVVELAEVLASSD